MDGSLWISLKELTWEGTILGEVDFFPQGPGFSPGY